MSTAGQFSSRNPTIKRILKEASELAQQPSADYHAAPLETDLFEWHFTLRGPPAPSPFENGLYHGRIVLPPAYPLKPPSFRFVTPTGRFEVNREICLSISGHHEETWQPAWGIRTALVAIRSFMDTDAKGQLGGMDASEEVRRKLAVQSRGWKCGVCGKGNEGIMREREEAVRESGAQDTKDIVRESLRLAYREELGEAKGSSAAREADGVKASMDQSEQVAAPSPTPTRPQTATPDARAAPQQQQRQQRARQHDDIPPWIDKAIYIILAALFFLLWKKLGS